ncbi:hypothetical protein GCM10022291_25380 [Postechiella marina]|uniref:Lipoprotein n=1 Tax=Postechiella marina TaxID=943941 RepID=A0ABP8CDH2_9FLAO
MKNKLKNLLKFGLTLLAIGLLLTNCEKENTLEEPLQVENQEPTFTLKYYSKENIEKNSKLVSKLKEFKDNLSENKSAKYSGKSIHNKEYDFTVYTDSATYIEYGDYHSYTFPLVQGADEKMTNVLFELNDQGEYDAYLVKYDYSANEYKTKDLTSLSLKTSIKPIDLAFNSLFARTMSYYRCIYTYEWRIIDSRMRDAESNTFEDVYGYVLDSRECETVYYDNGDTKTYNSSDGTATVTIGGTTYGGTGGSKTSPTPSPFDAEELMQINIVKSELNLKPLLYDSWINSHASTVFEIYYFGVANMWSDEAKVFTKSAIDYMMLDKKVDLEESFASPFNVDLELVKPSETSPEHEKTLFICIYNKLLKSPQFKELFKNVFEDNERLHVKFEFATDLEPTKGASTQVISHLVSNGNVIGINQTIKLNKDWYGARSDIKIAQSILHECIHAYLNVKQLECKETITLTQINAWKLDDLINQIYSENKSCIFSNEPANQDDHHFMFNNLVPNMANIISQLKNDLISEQHQTQAEADAFYNSVTNASEPFNWNDFFKYLAMDGLNETTVFKNNIKNHTLEFDKYNFYSGTNAEGVTKNNCND